MVRGFTFRSAPWIDQSNQNTNHRFALVFGYVSREPNTTCRKTPIAHFCLNYARKKFVNCAVRQRDCPAAYDMATRLHRGDPVLAGGILTTTSYVGKNGEKQTYELDSPLVLPLRAVLWAMQQGFGDAALPADEMAEEDEDILPDGFGLDDEFFPGGF